MDNRDLFISMGNKLVRLYPTSTGEYNALKYGLHYAPKDDLYLKPFDLEYDETKNIYYARTFYYLFRFELPDLQ